MGFIAENDALVWPFLFSNVKAELKALGYVVFYLDRHHISILREHKKFLPHDTLSRHMGDSHLANHMRRKLFPVVSPGGLTPELSPP